MAKQPQSGQNPTRPKSGADVGDDRRRARLRRHAIVAALAAILLWVFWLSRPNWVPEMRLWKAAGDAAFVLLVAALAIGPVAKLWPGARRGLRWRRQLGIWFAITASVHGLLILNGWAEWSLRTFLGYEFIPQLGREARIEPGFGLANLIGVVALLLALILAATSSDGVIRRLGRPAWQWLHRLSYTILILSLLHGGYFLFIHFTASFHKRVPDLDWFRIPFLLVGLSVVALEVAGFVRWVSGNGEASTA